jgi:hypothetical protein
MGIMGDYTPDTGSYEGVKRLTVLEFETVFSKNTGTEGKKFVFCKDQDTEHKMYKTIYASKKFNQFFTGYIVALGLNPSDLVKACGEGKEEEWMQHNIPGRSGDFDCRYGEPRQSDGKRFIEPFVRAEIEFKEWLASQNGAKPSSNEPPIDSYKQPFPNDLY